jgi:hypothetical protein
MNGARCRTRIWHTPPLGAPLNHHKCFGTSAASFINTLSNPLPLLLIPAVHDIDTFDDAWDMDPLEADVHLNHRRSTLTLYGGPSADKGKGNGNVVIPGNGPGGVGNGPPTPGVGGGVGGGSTGNKGNKKS